MKQNELRELDLFCAVHVMGYRPTDDPDSWTDHEDVLTWHRHSQREKVDAVLIGHPWKVKSAQKFDRTWTRFHPTEDPAAAMEVLKRCKVKVTKENGSIDIDGDENHSSISAQMRGEYAADTEHETEAKTLELAICRFAQKVFSK